MTDVDVGCLEEELFKTNSASVSVRNSLFSSSLVSLRIQYEGIQLDGRSLISSEIE